MSLFKLTTQQKESLALINNARIVEETRSRKAKKKQWREEERKRELEYIRRPVQL